MSQKGPHTWDIITQYHRCPECGYIMESRADFEYVLGRMEKELECPRCTHRFRITKPRPSTFGPLLG